MFLSTVQELRARSDRKTEMGGERRDFRALCKTD